MLAVEAAAAVTLLSRICGSSSDTHPGKWKKDKKGQDACRITSNFFIKTHITAS
jgi:hypothetical protein